MVPRWKVRMAKRFAECGLVLTEIIDDRFYAWPVAVAVDHSELIR